MNPKHQKQLVNQSAKQSAVQLVRKNQYVSVYQQQQQQQQAGHDDDNDDDDDHDETKS